MISDVFASILRSGRSEFNSRFAVAQRSHPELTPEAFSEFLRTAVDELVCAVSEVNGDGAASVTMIAYDTALELVGQKLAGPVSRLPVVEEGWRRILPKIAPLLAKDAEKIIPSVCNAIHYLASTPAARPVQWIEIMEQLGPRCETTESFLKLGQVAAWRAGLAHFRLGAIVAADSLPETLTLAVLGAGPGAMWQPLRARLLANPWFDPANSSGNAPAMKVVAQVGSFRGFGGLFVEPPRVVAAGEYFLARSGTECWLLTADTFGATFHRSTTVEFAAAAAHTIAGGPKIDGSSLVINGRRLEFPTLGPLNSVAANDHTVAVTSRLTHSIVLVALK